MACYYSLMGDILYQGHGWDIRMDEGRTLDGRIVKRARAHICDTVHILAFPDPGHVIIQREWRPYYQKFVWMIPSGKMDKDGESDSLRAAQRELQEETGYRASELRPYFVVRHAEHLDYTCNVFIARGLTPDPLPKDEDESMEVHVVTLDEAIKLALESDPSHTVTSVTLLRYAREHVK